MYDFVNQRDVCWVVVIGSKVFRAAASVGPGDGARLWSFKPSTADVLIAFN